MSSKKDETFQKSLNKSSGQRPPLRNPQHLVSYYPVFLLESEISTVFHVISPRIRYKIIILLRTGHVIAVSTREDVGSLDQSHISLESQLMEKHSPCGTLGSNTNGTRTLARRSVSRVFLLLGLFHRCCHFCKGSPGPRTTKTTNIDRILLRSYIGDRTHIRVDTSDTHIWEHPSHQGVSNTKNRCRFCDPSRAGL